MAIRDIFSSDFRDEPFWWIAAPRPADAPEPLPAKVDVAVVGSGVTGLNAARELARAGRNVLVIDAGALGIGASSRNAGNIGRVLKHEFSNIRETNGLETAVAYYREMQAAYDSVADVISTEAITCEYSENGRLILAYTEQQLKLVEAEAKAKQEHLGEAFSLLTRADLQSELASDSFVGGVYLPKSASIHPGLYHQGLLDAARRQGVSVAPFTTVSGIDRSRQTAGGTRFRVHTNRGSIDANDVIVAVNGYATSGVPRYLKQRLIPFDAYMIAIAVPEAELAAITPRDRVYIDANLNLFFFRRAPDNKHLLFGGRTGSRRPADLRTMGTALYDDACKIMPSLRSHKVSRAWTGRCAGTFDLYPHIGEDDGIHFAAGYCFAGIPMGTYLGRKVAFGLIGKGGETMFRQRTFPGVPGYGGSSWFVPYFMKYFDWLDRRSGGHTS